MKVSVAWLFDHIDARKSDIGISTLITRFNQTTAEIEGSDTIELPLEHVSLARVETHATMLINEVPTSAINIESTEWRISCSLPYRADSTPGSWFLIYRQKNATKIIYRWATIADMGGTKEELMPALYLPDNGYNGTWKYTVEKVDHVLHIDNKSLTHRPDLWGHRGLAREVAAIFDLPLVPIERFIQVSAIQAIEKHDNHGSTGNIHVTIQDTACDRFTGLDIPYIEYKPSLLSMALRLARIDCKPINAIVDITNYVMFDLGQPMHAFDRDKLRTKKITIRKAHREESLSLRDGTMLNLTPHDIVVCDTLPICLAGITGGTSTAISETSNALFIIAEHLNPASIRLSSAHHKIRTESSSRFEKNIDGQQTDIAPLRFLHLCSMASIPYKSASSALSLGKDTATKVITIEHAFIEQRLGTHIEPAFIIKTLRQLSFIIQQEHAHSHTTHSTIVYTITVPSFRATKDISIKEDIAEEIGRFYGYNSIPLSIPHLPLTVKDITTITRMRTSKRLLSDVYAMREVNTYPFYDESFLRTLFWEPDQCVTVQKPVSENWQRLVTSLIPNMIKAVSIESAEHDQLRFFEWGRVWHCSNGATQEKEVLSGIVYDKKKPVNFYDGKQIIHHLCDTVHIHTRWEPITRQNTPWLHTYKAARIMHNTTCLGIAGIIPESFLHTTTEGYAFVFELDAELLKLYKHPLINYTAPSRYPTVQRDISVRIPISLTVQQIIDIIMKSSPYVIWAELIDFFEKKEWLHHRSITVRCILSDQEKTMTKEDIDSIHHTIVQQLSQYEAEIR